MEVYKYIFVIYIYTYISLSNLHTSHTHGKRMHLSTSRGKNYETREPETWNNVWKKSKLGQKGIETRGKNNAQRKTMCRLRPHFPLVKPSGHVNQEGLMQFIEQELTLSSILKNITILILNVLNNI